jgi:hypothetical protein
VFELRALSLVGRSFTTWAMLPVHFALGIFKIGPWVYTQVSLNHYPIYASCIAEVTGSYYHAWLIYWLRWGLANFLFLLASNCSPPDVHLPETGLQVVKLTLKFGFFSFSFFGGTWVWTQVLSHTPRPFGFSYLSDRVLHFLPEPALVHSSYPGLPHSWDYIHKPPCLQFVDYDFKRNECIFAGF